MKLLIRSLALFSICTGLANATVVYYTSKLSFQAAATISNTADFEGLTTGTTLSNPITSNGISFQLLAGTGGVGTIYLAPASGLQNITQNPTEALTASGDENFRIKLVSGNAFTAIGFDFISNRFSPLVVDLYDVTNHLIGSKTLTQPVNTLGFFGVISDTPLGHIDTTVSGGATEDTGYDNVQIGLATAPEPSTLWLTLSAFALGLTVIRRRGERTLSMAKPR